MQTLLVLGSKPDPVLPAPESYNALACANASGYSARAHGLPVPAFTVISAILTSGIESGQQSLTALRGLETETLYYFPRPTKSHGLFSKLLHIRQEYRTSAMYFEKTLRCIPYHWRSLVKRDNAYYRALAESLCLDNEPLLAQMHEKSPSTGIMTLVIGMSLGDYERFVLSGFSFELTHAYADNPEIGQRGTRVSRHTPTDVQMLRHLSQRYRAIFTTEPSVHERAGVPLFVK
jgi:hypothetical protein